MLTIGVDKFSSFVDYFTRIMHDSKCGTLTMLRFKKRELLLFQAQCSHRTIPRKKQTDECPGELALETGRSRRWRWDPELLHPRCT